MVGFHHQLDIIVVFLLAELLSMNFSNEQLERWAREIDKRLRLMTVDQLCNFVLLARLKSTTKVGEVLKRNPQIFIKQVKNFGEQKKDQPALPLLILAGKKGVNTRVTDTGLAIQPEAEEVLQQLYLASLKLERDLPVKVALTDFMSNHPVAKAILEKAEKQLENKKLKVPLFISQTRTDDIQEKLLEFIVDFAIGGLVVKDSKSWELDSTIDFLPFAEDKLVLLSNRPLAKGRPAKDLIEENINYLLPPAGGWGRTVLEELVGASRVKDFLGSRVADGHFALDLLIHSPARRCILCREWVARTAETLNNRLSRVPLSLSTKLVLGFYRRRGRIYPESLKLFNEVAERILREKYRSDSEARKLAREFKVEVSSLAK